MCLFFPVQHCLSTQMVPSPMNICRECNPVLSLIILGHTNQSFVVFTRQDSHPIAIPIILSASVLIPAQHAREIILDARGKIPSDASDSSMCLS